MRKRCIMAGTVAALALVAIARHPSANIEILTHDATDRAPHQVKAALDLGLVGVSVLITWSKHLS